MKFIEKKKTKKPQISNVYNIQITQNKSFIEVSKTIFYFINSQNILKYLSFIDNDKINIL